MDWGDYDTVLYSKTNFYKSQPPQLPQQFGGAISQTGLPQNSISTSPSPITMTPCYILKRTFTKAQQFGGGAISQTGLPQNSISTSPSPITMTPCYILKTNFYKSQPPQLPQQFGGVLSRKPDYHKPPSPLPPPPLQ